ncbi:Mitochondrial inner membrane protease subunit 1 [Euphorbia peplus]|nr:Mitochondrial inner membrane protease subunit 1 [Euphorbia peplus]
MLLLAQENYKSSRSRGDNLLYPPIEGETQGFSLDRFFLSQRIVGFEIKWRCPFSSLREEERMNLNIIKSSVLEAANVSFRVAKFFCSLHVINTYLFALVPSMGPSMLPTLNITGDISLADRISPRIRKVRTGDIVLVCSPLDPKLVPVKRVKGVEGDSVTYLIDPKNSDETNTVVIPKGHIWVQGDNIYNSTDSRTFGPVPNGLVRGKLFWRVWPRTHFGPLGRNET